mgnify:CR=1 FL=1
MRLLEEEDAMVVVVEVVMISCVSIYVFGFLWLGQESDLDRRDEPMVASNSTTPGRETRDTRRDKHVIWQC